MIQIACTIGVNDRRNRNLTLKKILNTVTANKNNIGTITLQSS